MSTVPVSPENSGIPGSPGIPAPPESSVIPGIPASPESLETLETRRFASRIWADVDSLQPEIRDLLERRAESEMKKARARGSEPRFDLAFVSARKLRHKAGTKFMLVEPGPGAADDRIAAGCRPNDVAVTRDIPLAERLACAGITVLNDRGECMTADIARERRSLRDRALELRNLGLAPASSRERSWGAPEFKKFADTLDRVLARLT